MSESFTYRTDLFFLMVARQTLPVEFFDKERDHVLCFFCNAGRFSLTIDGTPYIVTPHQGIMCLPDTVLSDYMMSPDVQVDIFGYSWIALQHFEQVHKYVWDASQRIRENPVVTIKAQNLSPKYFSAVIKKESGRGPLEWIHEYTTQAIIRQLSYSDKSIKEISADLGFPNLSFFGKFVRAHLDTSPTEYRRLHGNRRTEKPDRS